MIIPREPLTTPFCLQLSKVTPLRKDCVVGKVVISLIFLGSVTAQVPPPIWSVTSILYLVLGLRPEIVTVVSFPVLFVGAETEVGVVDPGL